MKLLLVVVNNRDKRDFCDALFQMEQGFTEIGSTGGFLREGNTTLLIGVGEENVERILELVRDICQTRERTMNVAHPTLTNMGADVTRPMKILVGGAKVFILDVEEFIDV